MINCMDYYCLLYTCTQNDLWTSWLCCGSWLFKSHNSTQKVCRESFSLRFAPMVIAIIRFCIYYRKKYVYIHWGEYSLEDGHEDFLRKQGGDISLCRRAVRRRWTKAFFYDRGIPFKNPRLTRKRRGLRYLEGEVGQILLCLLNKILLRQLISVISGVPADSKISIKALQVFYSK